MNLARWQQIAHISISNLEIKEGLPVNNLPGVWNDPYCVAADDDEDDVDVDPGEGHLALSQSSLKLFYNFFCKY